MSVKTKLITFYNHKGGVTKTTSTILTATNLVYHFEKKVAIIDCDDDQWSTSEMKEGELLKVKGNYSEKELLKLFEDKKIVDFDVYKAYLNKSSQTEEVQYVKDILDDIKNEEYDYIFLDMGNRTLNQCEEIFSMVDLFIIPFSQDEDEIKKARQFYQLVNDVFPNSEKYMINVKVNKTPKRISTFNSLKEYLIDEKYNVFSQPILDRDRYKEVNKSFFFPMRKSEEEKEGAFNFFNFIKEFIQKT